MQEVYTKHAEVARNLSTSWHAPNWFCLIRDVSWKWLHTTRSLNPFAHNCMLYETSIIIVTIILVVCVLSFAIELNVYVDP